MKNATIPNVYAEALLELAESRGLLETVREEVDFLKRLFSDNSDLLLFFESPGIEEREKREVFEGALRGKLEDLVVNFLLLVIRRGRQLFFPDMLDAFRDLHDAKRGIIHARVATAVPLGEESSDALRESLEKTLGKQIVLDGVVDGKVLGGFVVRYKGMVLDASLEKALKEMESPLRAMKFGSELVHED
jgi:F-type H+-transporting ATPase subunit delta